jgi:Esterase-like activity of phytase
MGKLGTIRGVVFAGLAACAAMAAAQRAGAQVLLAEGQLIESKAGSYADLSGLKGTLENGAAANLLGGLGSAITYVNGNTFLALPDRGPNAVSYNASIDDTVSYINRFHTIQMNLEPNNTGSGLPFTLTPVLQQTTLLHSFLPLAYGKGGSAAGGVGPGAPAQNNFLRHYFTGRSDNFDPNFNSGFPFDARFDTEGIRISNDGLTVFISDEYGPYVYQFLRATGERLRTFQLPSAFYVTNLSSMGATEISGNTSGRVANKGMEGLAITPDGRTLVGIMQNALIQDAAAAPNLLRIVTIDIASGQVTHQFGYNLTTGSGVSEITALNEHEFLVDERDGKGLGDGSKAKVKQIFKIDLAGATDISKLDPATAAANAVSKTLFLDVVALLTANGITADQIPSKIEGISFGPDVEYKGQKIHTFWIANDNDFVQDESGPNVFFVVGITDAEFNGSKFVPQVVRNFPFFF